MTGVSIRLRSIENPYPQRSIMHAELATAPYGVILPIWRFGRLRPADHFIPNCGCAHYACVPVHPNAHPVAKQQPLMHAESDATCAYNSLSYP